MFHRLLQFCGHKVTRNCTKKPSARPRNRVPRAKIWNWFHTLYDFSRHDTAKTSFVLLIWLDEKVLRFATAGRRKWCLCGFWTTSAGWCWETKKLRLATNGQRFPDNDATTTMTVTFIRVTFFPNMGATHSECKLQHLQIVQQSLLKVSCENGLIKHILLLGNVQ